MKKKGFTLVELLAVIAILAIILLIAVPQILGVIDDAREDSFRNSVRNIFHAVELKNARENLTSGNISDLDLSGEVFLSGTWSIAGGKITLSDVCNKDYKIEGNLEDTNKGTTFTVVKSNGTCNSTPASNYLVDVVSDGDFVAYDAGSWTETVAEATSQGGFGGYTSGTSKSTSVACYDTSYPNQYSGWRVLLKSGSGATGTVTLVHAGTPECYYHGYPDYSSASVVNLNNRAQSQYVNSTYATSARSINCSDVQKYDSTACSSYPTITNDMVKTGSVYWLAVAYNTNGLWRVDFNGGVLYSDGFSFGLRPVVVLKSGILKTSGSGTSSSAYEISI